MINLLLYKKSIRKVLISVSFLLFFFIVFVKLSQAQTIVQESYKQICLDALNYDVDTITYRCDEGKCTDHIPPAVANYTLEGKGFPTNTPIYPFVCIDNEKGFAFSEFEGCVANIAENSNLLFGINNVFDYTIDNSVNGTVMADSTGKLTVTGKITGADMHTHYKWYGGFFLTDMGSGGDETELDENLTQQLGTVNFEQIFSSEESKIDCVEIRWDPYGRVFDSVSLEPISAVDVSLFSVFDRNKLITFKKGDNPVKTKSDGVFNFVVPEGIYSLRLSNIPSTHVFSKTPKLNPKYYDIYHKARDGKKSIYYPDDEIKEIIDSPEEEAIGMPFLEERDVPLDPGENPPYTADIVNINGVEHQVTNGYSTKYSGKASHPYPIVSLIREDNNETVFRKEFLDEEARYGFWKFVVENNLIPNDTSLVVKLEKNPKYFTSVSQNTDEINKNNSIVFEPILRIVKGYAYDFQGNVIPNAVVKVRYKMNNAVYSQTEANENGYFELFSNQLPYFEYYLQYLLPEGHDLYSLYKQTSEFSYENKDFITQASYDPMKEGEILKGSTKDMSLLNNEPQDFMDKNNKDKTVKTEKKYDNIIFVAAVIVSLIITGGAAYFIYIRTKRKTSL